MYPMNLGQAWHWLSGNPEDAIIAAAGGAEPVAWVVRWVRRKLDSKILDALRAAAGDSGIGYTEDQISGQSGSEPRRVRSALRRLKRTGEVREAEGRWYLTGKKRHRHPPVPRFAGRG